MKEGKGWRSGLIRGRQTDLQEIPTDVRNHNNTQQEITTETEQKKKKTAFLETARITNQRSTQKSVISFGKNILCANCVYYSCKRSARVCVRTFLVYLQSAEDLKQSTDYN